MKFNLLLINGWAAKPEVFSPLVESIREYIDKVLIIDWYDSKLSTFDRINNMVHILSETTPSRPTLIGAWSSGTMPLLSYLGSDKIDSSVRGAFLLGATARFVTSSTPDYSFGWHKEILEQMVQNFDSDSRAVIDAFSDKAMSVIDKESSSKVEAFKACFQMDALSQTSHDELKSGLEFLAHSDVRMRVQKILHPLLIIAGEKDRICPIKGSDWIHEHSSDASIYRLSDAGHAPHFFQPEVCRNIIEEYIKELDLK